MVNARRRRRRLGAPLGWSGTARKACKVPPELGTRPGKQFDRSPIGAAAT